MKSLPMLYILGHTHQLRDYSLLSSAIIELFYTMH